MWEGGGGGTAGCVRFRGLVLEALDVQGFGL